ncbi:MAG: cellulose biosynthesis protein BcsS [Thiobacillus sp.]
MKMKQSIIVLATVLAAGSAQAGSTAIFVGIGGADDTMFSYLGGVHALGGDIDKTGVLLRGMVGYGEYDYDTTAVAGGSVEGEQVNAELAVGYQWVMPGSRVSLYAGVDYQEHDLSPNDVFNSVNGDETGGLIQAELETTSGAWHGSLIGKYSSAYDSYWARGRVGYAMGGATFGPEVAVGGNEEYDETRYGAFVNFDLSSATAVSLSAGYREAEGDASRNDQDGGYASLNVTFKF